MVVKGIGVNASGRKVEVTITEGPNGFYLWIDFLGRGVFKQKANAIDYVNHLKVRWEE